MYENFSEVTSTVLCYLWSLAMDVFMGISCL